MSIKVFIENNPLYFSIINYTIQLILSSKGFEYVLSNTIQDADIVINETPQSDLTISLAFYQKLNQKIFSHQDHLSNDYFIRDKNGNKDFIATVFYLVNCIQEYDFPKSQLDHYGRFPFEESLQNKFGIIEKNIVQEIINHLFKNNSFLSQLKQEKNNSKLLVSHDIDFIYNSSKREFKWALKHFNLFALAKAFASWLRISNWLNLDAIYSINSKYQHQTQLFWITKNGDYDNIQNSDYNFKDQYIQKTIKKSQALGIKNSLHKSTHPSSIDEECNAFEYEISHNRYHYLKYELPNVWSQLEASSIQVDHSLSFGSKMGFRNSYGKAFKPYNFETKKAYELTVVPFQIMDSTFMYYSKKSSQRNLLDIKNFITHNKSDVLLSLVWHNTSFSEYSFKTQKEQYIEILEHCKSLGIKPHAPLKS